MSDPAAKTRSFEWTSARTVWFITLVAVVGAIAGALFTNTKTGVRNSAVPDGAIAFGEYEGLRIDILSAHQIDEQLKISMVFRRTGPQSWMIKSVDRIWCEFTFGDSNDDRESIHVLHIKFDESFIAGAPSSGIVWLVIDDVPKGATAFRLFFGEIATGDVPVSSKVRVD